ncbi:hypothetical protein NL676_039804 [Syzygium grande]|nr:hypothetical protein NL676_039804 [Syzygium grande]
MTNLIANGLDPASSELGLVGVEAIAIRRRHLALVNHQIPFPYPPPLNQYMSNLARRTSPTSFALSKTSTSMSLLEHKLVREMAPLVPMLKGLICSKNAEISKSVKRIEELKRQKRDRGTSWRHLELGELLGVRAKDGGERDGEGEVVDEGGAQRWTAARCPRGEDRRCPSLSHLEQLLWGGRSVGQVSRWRLHHCGVCLVVKPGSAQAVPGVNKMGGSENGKRNRRGRGRS